MLEEDRVRTHGQIAALSGDHADIVAASVDSNADDEHDPEGATIAFERSQVGALLAHARHRLTEIEDALERLRSGTYGRCASCGGVVPRLRLEARPTARTCIHCADQATGGTGLTRG